MIGAVMKLLRWLLKYWKDIFRWLGTTLLISYGIFWGIDQISTTSSWLLGHWSDCFDYAAGAIDTLSEEITSFALNSSGWVKGVFDLFQVDYFVAALVGWSTFALVVLEWTLIGVGLGLVGLAGALIYFKLHLKGVKDVSKSS